MLRAEEMGTGWFFQPRRDKSPYGSETKASKTPPTFLIPMCLHRKSSKTSNPPSNNSAKSLPT